MVLPLRRCRSSAGGLFAGLAGAGICEVTASLTDAVNKPPGVGHGCWSTDALTVSREWVTSGRLGSLARPPGFTSAGRSLRCRRFGCVMLAGILRAHLARIHLGWRPWLSSRRTAPVVAGWFESARRACSRGWRSDWPFSGAVGNHRTAIPVNSLLVLGAF